MLQDIMSQDMDAILDSTIKFRKVLSKEKNPPIHIIIEAGIVPRLVELLTFDQVPMIQVLFFFYFFSLNQLGL